MTIIIDTMPPEHRAHYPADPEAAQELHDTLSGDPAWAEFHRMPPFRMTWRAWRAVLWDRPRGAIPIGPFRCAVRRAWHANRDARAFPVRFGEHCLTATRCDTQAGPALVLDLDTEQPEQGA